MAYAGGAGLCKRGHTTVGDLLKSARALQAGKLLSKAMLAEALQPRNEAGWYDFGFIIVGQGPLHRYGHGGASPGMNADFRASQNRATC